MRRFKGKLREDGVGYGKDAWPALHETFDGCWREALRAVHREIETMQTWSDKDPDSFLNKKDRCRDHPNSFTPEENLSDRQYEDIILQYLRPKYDRNRQTYFQREDCNLPGIRRRISNIYADNLARFNSSLSRSIAGRGVALQTMGQDLSNIDGWMLGRALKLTREHLAVAPFTRRGT